MEFSAVASTVIMSKNVNISALRTDFHPCCRFNNAPLYKIVFSRFTNIYVTTREPTVEFLKVN